MIYLEILTNPSLTLHYFYSICNYFFPLFYFYSMLYLTMVLLCFEHNLFLNFIFSFFKSHTNFNHFITHLLFSHSSIATTFKLGDFLDLTCTISKNRPGPKQRLWGASTVATLNLGGFLKFRYIISKED